MATVAACIQCFGEGVVEFSEERGGPVCPHCGGKGYLTPDLLQVYIAAILDHPSVHMGGPSITSMKRAKRIIELLQAEKIIPMDEELNKTKPSE